MEYKTARFTNPSKTLIRYEYVVEGGVRVNFEAYDTASERCQDILKQFPVEKLTENYDIFCESEAKFRLALEHLKDQELGQIDNTMDGPPVSIFETLLEMTKENDSEGLFKIKLEVIESPEMEKADKQTKSAIRKAENAIDVIALYQSYVKSQSAS